MFTISNILTPINSFFLIAFIGIFLGQIKIFGIKLDISAVLIISLIYGILISKIQTVSIITENINFFDGELCSLISLIGSSIFISCIGLKSSGMIKIKGNIKILKAFFCGIITVTIGFAVLTVLMKFDKSTPEALLCGLFSGAMTSTPALSTSCEVFDDALPVSGYGISYVFGTLLIVLFVQMFFKPQKEQIFKNQNQNINIVSDKSMLLMIFLTSFIGAFIGEISVIGRSGGILISSIIGGLIINKKELKKFESSIIEKFGLILFFIGKGVPSGRVFFENVSIKYFLYGVLITLSSIIFGYIISVKIIKYSNIDALAVICGGMTSTPAISILNAKSNNIDVSLYTASYIGALTALIFGVKIFFYV